jgi:isocitrate dehydrogenase (NAD+)
MPAPTRIVVLHGDQTGEELLRDALRFLDPELTGVPVRLEHFDLSLASRRATRNQVVLEASDALLGAGYGIKAATVTPEQKGDVGSPNAILRARIGGQVIVRTGRRIPSVRPVAGVYSPISVIRMAVDDAYGATEWREGEGLDEWAFRTEKISRRTCKVVAEYAFYQARRLGAKVFGGPKYTVSPVYEGMFKEELDAAAARHPDVGYDPQLIDATYAMLVATSGEPLVIPALNRDGDTLPPADSGLRPRRLNQHSDAWFQASLFGKRHGRGELAGLWRRQATPRGLARRGLHEYATQWRLDAPKGRRSAL